MLLLNVFFPYLNQIKRWNDWTSWNAVTDPSLQASYEGEEEGLGAIRKWTSEEQMNGILTIVQSNMNENIQYHLDLNDHYFILKGHIRLDAIGASQTQVTWLCYTESSRLNPFKRLQTAALKKLFIRHLQTNLVQLKMIAEQE